MISLSFVKNRKGHREP